MNSSMQPDYRRRLEAAEARVQELESILAETLTREAEAQREKFRERDELVSRFKAAEATIARYGEPLNEVYETDGVDIVRKNLRDLRARADAAEARVAQLEATNHTLRQQVTKTAGRESALQANATYWRTYADERRAEIDRLVADRDRWEMDAAGWADEANALRADHNNLLAAITALADEWDFDDADAANTLRALLNPPTTGETT